MSIPTATPAGALPSCRKAFSGSGPDAQRLQAQLAGLVECGSGFAAVGEVRPFLEFLRALLNAGAVGLIPIDESSNSESCIVSSRGVAAQRISQIAATLGAPRAVVQAAAELGADGYTLAVPVVRETRPIFWLIVQLSVADPRDLQAFLVLLQALAGFLLYREQRRATGEIHLALERTSGLLEIVRRAGGEQDFERACMIAVDDLCVYLGCDRASFATKRRAGLQMRAISGIAKIDTKSTSHAPTEAAMREALRANGRIDFRADSARTSQTAAHEILQAQTGAAQISTVPLAHGRGALLLEWKGAGPDARGRVLFDATTPFLAAILELIERARPHPAAFVAQRWWRSLSAHRRRTAGFCTLGLLALLAFPVRDDIKADCRLVPTLKRVIAAPFQGQLKKSFVLPGDRVEVGAALAELENRELKLKEAELIAAREKALKQRDKAMSNEGEGGDFVDGAGREFRSPKRQP